MQVGLGAGETLDMNTHKIECVVDPTVDQDAATKKYVDDNIGGVTVVASDPASESNGAMILNTTTHTIKIWYSGEWKLLHTISLAEEFILLETGDFALLETGDKIIIE